MDHVQPERLLAIAMADDLMFTFEELDHIKACPECLGKWQACIIVERDEEESN